ncbi:lanosterol synthase, putative [Leishmania donovani]|uniref:Lanosterol synthase, putative n=1 Tax=Leishmania donovani TaxID=5661 RepID=A0A3S5H5R6_LEIDO|nr:lanosterol synthase, putative [Leishmania donovani]AYU76097.1 lanosterol synthase, putative [Leishmania donovani]TPP54844.1 squalene/oxidosqualene cyclases family protein [Leishmania donovani]CBZ31650.1 lanosterol synthase, putative [Leishmania donovani]
MHTNKGQPSSSRAAVSGSPTKPHDTRVNGLTTSSCGKQRDPPRGAVTNAVEFVSDILRNLYARVAAIAQPYAAEHASFVEYQRTLPVRTVVPEPPNTLRDYIRRQLWCVGRTCLFFFFFLFTWPVWLTLHLLLKLLDAHQRRLRLQHHRAWVHPSVPHVRANVHKHSKEFPLGSWHLRCEDGRQRWYFGEPLREGEEHNELAMAQLCGLHTVGDYHALLRQRAASDSGGGDEKQDSRGSGFNGTGLNGAGVTNSRVPWLPDILQEKCSKRSFVERYHIGLIPASPPQPRTTSEAAMDDGIRFLVKLQDPFSGHWPNNYSGCMFLVAGFVITKYIVAGGETNRLFPPFPDHHHVRLDSNGTKRRGNGGDIPERILGVPAFEHAGEVGCRCGEATRQELIRYIRNHQNPDGGWGQHTEGHSTMMGTVLNYVSVRLLGVPASDPQATCARNWILAHGGATKTPMWGRVWLSILGVYSWDGVNPIPPEMILMPDWIPFSLGKMWCHSRVIAMPFSYFYGLRWSAPAFPTTLALRKELYTEPYDAIPWRSFRGVACELDVYTPTSPLLRVAMGLFDLYERHPIPFLRRYALEENWRHIAYDDESTSFICLGPVNKWLNMLATWVREGEHSARFQKHCHRVQDYFYLENTGLSMSGYNGSQLWDTSFAVQAICACRREMMFPAEMELAHHYIDVAQVQANPMAAADFYRHRTKGAWNFSTRAQGWQVSDCTAEGLRVLLLLPQYEFPVRRIFDGVDEVLSLRNSGFGGDGGWASYEPTRGPAYCELLDCAELFKDVMIDYSYVECSSSCIHTLSLFREHYPHYRRRDVDRAISEGIAYVLGQQQPDGGFYGSWGICYTYAAWLVADALQASKELPDMAVHPHCVKLVDFLLSHQGADGGWSEDVSASARQTWVDSPDGSQVVNTAWAVMAIICAAGKAAHTEPTRQRNIRSAVDRGVQLIMSRQLASGDWPQERISGVFNGNNPIHYPGYKNSMTVWALGKYNSWKREYVVAA